MTGRFRRAAGRWALPLVALACSLPAGAAPLDALLSAAPPWEDERWHGRVELAGDLANDALDVFGWRSRDAQLAGTQIGDYHGRHWRAEAGVGRWQFDGGTWQRRLQDRADEHHMQSWQAAAQVRFGGVDDERHLALRLSLWGNRAGQLTRSTNTRLNVEGLDTQVQQVTLQSPNDRQAQLDALFTQTWRTQRFSVFVGGGAGRVDNAGVSGRSTIGSCPYQLDFGSTHLTATPSGSCGLVIRVPNAVLPYAADPETHYRTRFFHAGMSHAWQGAVWHTRLGWEHQVWRRPTIDPLIEQRGGTAYTQGDVLIAELGARLPPHWGAFVRAQLMSHQFLGEIPMGYNTLTASKFDKPYGFVTAGITAGF